MSATSRKFSIRGHAYDLDLVSTDRRHIVTVAEDGHHIDSITFKNQDDVPSPLDVVEKDIIHRSGSIASKLA